MAEGQTQTLRSERSTSNSVENGSEGFTGGPPISTDSRSTHWDAVLHEIGAIKDAYDEGDEEHKIHIMRTGESSEPSPQHHRHSILHGMTQPPPISEIEADLPPKETCEKLVARFFDAYSPAMPARNVLHRPTVEKQLQSHFADPSKTRVIWIGFLFGIMCTALHTYPQRSEVDEAPKEYQNNLNATAELFRVRTAECLIHADITKPRDLLLETLILYSLVEYIHEADGAKGVMLLSSIIMRLATQQGYHRDPNQQSNLTIFQREMRRRVWAVVDQFELLFSAQLGIPKVIRYAECDTGLMSNVSEDDLYEEMVVMPPSRPLSERTQVSYSIVKANIMRAYGNVIEFLHIVEPQPYSEVLRLDTILMNVRQDYPPHFQLRSLEEMEGDLATDIMQRFILQQCFHKGICLLHRKFWNCATMDNGEPTFYYSRRTSVASAMALLNNQAEMHQISGPGKALEKERWWKFGINNHDYMLAAMILSLDLVCEQKDLAIRSSAGSLSYPPPILLPEKIQVLQRTLGIWMDVQNNCKDAGRAIQILHAVMAKLRVRPEYAKIINGTASNVSATTMTLPYRSDDCDSPHQSALWNADPYMQKQFQIDVPSTGLATSNIDGNNNSPMGSGKDYLAGNGFTENFAPGNWLDPFEVEADMEVPMDFDWNTWDNFMYGVVTGPPPGMDQY
ncbi:hypothetical protein BP5796_10936 [Coleophoma crateriformis]|uniref:Xylanolytic transcriptional activator regulatory domain-containing protein n=1 Tax=Coleophoma crateriformis TaxID=565419 RepID=A0A3D8QME8_9HELO|nr:hypothetical protein BP5796_10936 [Coleophoma crateriformis]